MKLILGGGLTALLARDILGSNWMMVPIGRSLYYSFIPPLCDNYVIKDSTIDDYMSQWAYIPIYTKIAFSYGGQITYNQHLALQPWLERIYGGDLPPQAGSYWKNHLEYFAYGDCVDMYRRLQAKYKEELLGSDSKWGIPISIKDGVIKTDKLQSEYDEIISTIPLHALLPMVGITADLPSRDLWCYHLLTDCLDFEGATSLFVVDQSIEFFKATNIGPNSYVFYSTKEIVQPGRYFMALMKRFELTGETRLERAIPRGPIPQFEALKNANITCLGRNAVWDDCMDVGTCIKRLLRR